MGEPIECQLGKNRNVWVGGGRSRTVDPLRGGTRLKGQKIADATKKRRRLEQGGNIQEALDENWQRPFCITSQRGQASGNTFWCSSASKNKRGTRPKKKKLWGSWEKNCPRKKEENPSSEVEEGRHSHLSRTRYRVLKIGKRMDHRHGFQRKKRTAVHVGGKR